MDHNIDGDQCCGNRLFLEELKLEPTFYDSGSRKNKWLTSLIPGADIETAIEFSGSATLLKIPGMWIRTDRIRIRIQKSFWILVRIRDNKWHLPFPKLILHISHTYTKLYQCLHINVLHKVRNKLHHVCFLKTWILILIRNADPRSQIIHCGSNQICIRIRIHIPGKNNLLYKLKNMR